MKLIMRAVQKGDSSNNSMLGLALYDLSTDPDELHNLATSRNHADDVQRLLQLLDRWWQPMDSRESGRAR